jgi:DNA-binding response OmpR family regulator
MSTVLIVEDEAFLQLYWEEVCKEEGVDVAAMVGTVKEAMELIRVNRFSGVILDVTLLDGTSEPVADMMRKTLTPGLICTGELHRLSSCYHGFNLIEKPASFDDMTKALNLLLK